MNSGRTSTDDRKEELSFSKKDFQLSVVFGDLFYPEVEVTKKPNPLASLDIYSFHS
jgi:hypothetical protein